MAARAGANNGTECACGAAWYRPGLRIPSMPGLLPSELGKPMSSSRMPDLVPLQNLPAVLSSWKHFQVY